MPGAMRMLRLRVLMAVAGHIATGVDVRLEKA
jgi:hypothetical protein